jgi:hypothetical protein
MTHLSKDAAIENVKKFFSNTPEDTISIEKAYMAWERDLTQTERNKGWFSNKMVDLKYHNLVKSIYAMKNQRRVLDKIQLTMEGKKALGRIGDDSSANGINTTNGNGESLSISDVMKIVAKLKKDSPDYEITFDVKLKNV